MREELIATSEEIRIGDHITILESLIGGTVDLISPKAIMISAGNGQHVNPYTDVWIPLSQIEVVDGNQGIAEKAYECGYRNLNCVLPQWLISKISRKLGQRY